MTKPAAQILLERYWEDCSNQGDVELVRELCADPIIRHDPGSETPLSHDDQIARLKVGIEMGIKIDRVVTHANDEWVTSVWNMYSERDDIDGMSMCGIEVFKVADGVLAEAWNTPYAEGHWTAYDS